MERSQHEEARHSKKRVRLVPRIAMIAAFLGLISVIIVGCGESGGANSSSGTQDPSGTEAKAAHGGTMTISNGEEVITFDPMEASSSTALINQINETLFKPNVENKVEPWLAESFHFSNGGKVLTLNLRKGVKFTNGQPMTSADVLFTLERGRKSPAWESQLAGITKVEAPSPSQVVITNSAPAPELPAILCQWTYGIVPNNFGGMSEKEFSQRPIGTGPFELESWKRGESVTLAKNPSYWDSGLPYLNKLVFQSVNDPNSRVAQLEAGDLDAIAKPPWSTLDNIESKPGLVVGNYPLGYVQILALNSSFPLFKDQRVREAVSLALDREGVVKVAASGRGEPAGSFFQPPIPFRDTDIKAPAQDVEKAKALLEEAVKDTGVSPSFSLLTAAGDPFWSSAAQVVQQNLEEVGFKVKLQSFEEATTYEDFALRKFDAYGVFSFDAIPTPNEIVAFYNGYEAEYTGANTVQTEKLANEAASEVAPDKRRQSYWEFQEVIDNEKFIIPVVYTPFTWAYKDNVVNLNVGGTGQPWYGELAFAK